MGGSASRRQADRPTAPAARSRVSARVERVIEDLRMLVAGSAAAI
jgi:hypothetical protein